MLVAFRQRHPLPEAYLWMWADSSPQATFDIFQTEMLALSKKESVDALLSAWNLASLRLEPFDLLTTMSVRDPLDAVEDVEGVVGPDDCLPLQSDAAAKLLELLAMRTELALSLRSMLVRHINIPQMLASGNTTLEKNELCADRIVVALYPAPRKIITRHLRESRRLHNGHGHRARLGGLRDHELGHLVTTMDVGGWWRFQAGGAVVARR